MGPACESGGVGLREELASLDARAESVYVIRRCWSARVATMFSRT